MSLALEHSSTQPSLPPPPPPEELVLASSRANTEPQIPPPATVDRQAFVRTYREAMSYFDIGEWDLAEEALKGVVNIWADSGIYVLLGYTYFFRDDYTWASHYFRKATKQNPQDLAAHFSLALTHNRLGKTKKAISDIWSVIKLRHDDPNALFLLGYLRHQLHQWYQAEQAYRKALRLKQDFSVVYQYLALMYFEMGSMNEDEREERLREAIETYQEMINIVPDAAGSYINIGFIYDQLGEGEQAGRAYRKAVQFAISNNDFTGLIAIGMELLNVRRYEEARSVFKRALQLMEEYRRRDGISRVQVLSWIGTAALQSDESRTSEPPDAELLREAEESYLEALNIDSNYIHAQLGLGATYYAQGRVDDAIQAFKRALEIDPDNESARANLAALVEEKLEHRLFEIGLLKQIKKPITDFTQYQNRTPIVVRGKPVSETLVEDRR